MIWNTKLANIPTGLPTVMRAVALPRSESPNQPVARMLRPQTWKGVAQPVTPYPMMIHQKLSFDLARSLRAEPDKVRQTEMNCPSHNEWLLYTQVAIRKHGRKTGSAMLLARLDLNRVIPNAPSMGIVKQVSVAYKMHCMKLTRKKDIATRHRSG
jgi:hypothetical protein